MKLEKYFKLFTFMNDMNYGVAFPVWPHRMDSKSKMGFHSNGKKRPKEEEKKQDEKKLNEKKNEGKKKRFHT